MKPLLFSLVALAPVLVPALVAAQDVAGTKLPYAPRQDAATYEPAPAGFVPVYTQLVARHGSRGLTGMKGELALRNLCLRARAEHALTPLGARLLADLDTLIRVNALLGAGVEGVTTPGYGNLSQAGIAEHRGLAQRAVARLPALFAAAGTRAVLVEHSGVDRARDSARVFTAALVAAQPALASRIEDGGANRYTLYFHKLDPAKDGAQDEWQRDVLRASGDYRAWLKSRTLADRLAAIAADPRRAAIARTTFSRLFTPGFVRRLARGDVKAANTGSLTFTGADGAFTTTLDGDGKTTIAGLDDALDALTDAHDIAPGLAHELARELGQTSFARYLAPADAHYLAGLKDAEDFYEKGPGILERQGVTWRMAEGLVAEFFRELDDDGESTHLAHLRFTHAEIIVPFAAALGLPGKSEPLPAAVRYSHAASPWRSAEVAPYAANVQWDIFRDAGGRRLVRMLYNEAETDFKPACDAARVRPGSHYYDVARLRACYGRTVR